MGLGRLSAAALAAVRVATVAASAPSSASGNSSATVIHAMHPAANPRPNGSSAAKVSTNASTGAARRLRGR